MTHPNANRWAWIFPGQGGQFVGMSRDLFRSYPVARAVAEEAEARTGLPLRRFALNGPVDELRRPEVLEPWLAATSIAYVDVLRSAGFSPTVVAGYSAGEVGAYYAAGVLGRTEALEVAIERGELLREAARSLSGGMSAVLRLEGTTVADVVAEMIADGRRVALAAENAPQHTTVTGETNDLARLTARLKSLGGEVHPVDVAGPWHAPWMRETADALIDRLANVTFAHPKIPIYNGATGRETTDPQALMVALADQLATTVRWRTVLDLLHRRGVRSFLEVGAGRVLRDLIRRNFVAGEEVERLEGVEGHGGGGGPLRRRVAASVSHSSVPSNHNVRPSPVEPTRSSL